MFNLIIDTEEGLCLPDGKVVRAVKGMIANYRTNKERSQNPYYEEYHRIGCDTIFTAFRVAVLRGLISKEELTITSGGKAYTFCDTIAISPHYPEELEVQINLLNILLSDNMVTSFTKKFDEEEAMTSWVL